MDFFFHAHFIDWQWYDVQWDIVRGVIPSICGHFQYGGGLTAPVITSWKQAKATRIYQSVLRPDGRHHQDLVITHISRFQTGMVNLRLVLPPCLQDEHIKGKRTEQERTKGCSRSCFCVQSFSSAWPAVTPGFVGPIYVHLWNQGGP